MTATAVVTIMMMMMMMMRVDVQEYGREDTCLFWPEDPSPSLSAGNPFLVVSLSI